MEQDLFTYLPPEIIINILSRLPVGTAMICKCVRKSWLGLIESVEFAKSHFSAKSASTTLALFQGRRSSIVKFTDDELDPERFAHQCNAVFNSFSFPNDEPVHSSVNGLLFLCNQEILPENLPRDLFICNPITRDCIKLPPPKVVSTASYCRLLDTFGFGVSKRRGEYKVVRMFRDPGPPGATLYDMSKCEVYTLGTGSWRSVATGGRFLYECMNLIVFLEGNLHCMVTDDLDVWISCFDLETELFSTFPIPQYLFGDVHRTSATLCALGDCLCFLCGISLSESGIWLMKEYGNEKSWVKEFVISIYDMNISHDCLFPIKVFKDGNNILLGGEHTHKLFCLSSKTRTILEQIDINGWFDEIDTSRAVIYTPSFLPLKTFAMENVSSF